MSARRTNFYLDKRNKRLAGVCAGIADYFGWDPLWIRVGFVVATFSGVGFLPLIYLATAFIADPKPDTLYSESDDDRRFWTNVRVAPRRTIREVNAAFRDADRRLRDLEAYVTSSNARLAREIEDLR
ncbi:MAG: envelope stress response membrane protein PspC [Polymorphobacter sp.]|uniref:envelope stress response membrane protein PspC n=1 Tax=Polymorphobacter sp. TaxID=1909290 RepID=UPI003A8AB078